jgi:hypothetical protein
MVRAGRVSLFFASGLASGLAPCLAAGCGSDERGPDVASSSGEGGATTAVAAVGGAGGGGGGASDVSCIGCGEQLTTSDAMAVLCEGSAPLWAEWTSCACVACADTCGAACELPANPACSMCRVEVAYGACADAYQACGKDL